MDEVRIGTSKTVSNEAQEAIEAQIEAEAGQNPIAREKARIQRLVTKVVAFAVAHGASLEKETRALALYELMGAEAPPELTVREGQCIHLPHQWLEIRAESAKVEEPRWIFVLDVAPMGIHVATNGCTDLVPAAVVVWEPWSIWQGAYIGVPIRGVGVTPPTIGAPQ